MKSFANQNGVKQTINFYYGSEHLLELFQLAKPSTNIGLVKAWRYKVNFQKVEDTCNCKLKHPGDVTTHL